MAEQIPTSMDLIVATLRARVGLVVNLPPERVIVVQRSRLEQEAQADQYVMLQVGGGSFDEPNYRGGGRFNTQLKRKCKATLRTRLATDEPTQDNLWLSDRALGHLAAEHRLFDALAGWTPEDAQGNALTFEPIRPVAVETPLREAKNKNKALDWGQSAFEFEVSYQLRLDTTVF